MHERQGQHANKVALVNISQSAGRPAACMSMQRVLRLPLGSRIANCMLCNWNYHWYAGAGGWSLSGSHIVGAPFRPHVSCTSLLAWVDDGRLAVSMQGAPLAIFRTADDELKLASELAGGHSGPRSEGVELLARPQDVRGLAVMQSLGSSMQDGHISVVSCDSAGKLTCFQPV